MCRTKRLSAKRSDETRWDVAVERLTQAFSALEQEVKAAEENEKDDPERSF